MRFQKVKQKCSSCHQDMALLEYLDTDPGGWTLFSDGYRYYPNVGAPWHNYKICPHCSKAFVYKVGSAPETNESLPNGDSFSPRERVRAILETELGQGESRKDLLIMDMWVSNHIYGEGADEITIGHMKELLEMPEESLDPIIRADILRQLGKFDEARSLLEETESALADPTQRIHIKSILSFLSRRECEASAVLTDGRFVPPTGRLAIHRGSSGLS